MNSRFLSALLVGAALTLGGLAGIGGGPASASPLASAGSRTPSLNAPVATAGHGTGTPQTVDVRALARGPQRPVHASTEAPRGRDGRPVGAGLPVRPSTGHKPMPATLPAIAGGPNGSTAAHPPASPVLPFTAPSTVNANFDGLNRAASGCRCQPPDPSAAVGSTEIAQTVNVIMRVYSKTGTALCTVGLNTFFNTSNALSDPKIQYDSANNRFSMTVTAIPPSSTATPTLFVAATTSGDACAGWFKYKLGFNGPSYPAGALLDQPRLGQDPAALLFSTDNFSSGQPNASFIDSVAFTIPKSRIYNGLAVSFTSFSVAFATQPVTVVVSPFLPTDAFTYYLASVPGTGYDLYRMANSGTSPSLVLQATISAPFSAPTRQVNQPGTSVTLQSDDGRIPWAPIQEGPNVWFTHGISIAGFPGIRYGEINVTGNVAFVARAFHGSTSDDFNPSIAVAVAPAGVRIWLNWAYTDTPNGVAASDTVNGVLPNTGTPDLIGTDRTLVTGSFTTQAAPGTTTARFGDYSSVELDPTAVSSACPVGQTAVLAQQYFTAGGAWATRIARVSFCQVGR